MYLYPSAVGSVFSHTIQESREKHFFFPYFLFRHVSAHKIAITLLTLLITASNASSAEALQK